MIIVLLGVAGSGKSTVGRLLADALGFEFHDADDWHPQHNKRKMRSGTPLTDADREPWLASLRLLIESLTARGRDAVLAFSGLKQAYREFIALPGVQFVYLYVSRDVLSQRLKARRNHYFDPALLTSQLESLEEPTDALMIEALQPPHEIVGRIAQSLKLELAGPAGARACIGAGCSRNSPEKPH